jgi:hypothetical protein
MSSLRLRARGSTLVLARPVEGARADAVSAPDVERIWRLAEEAGFFELDASYEWDNPACGPQIADLPSTILRVTAEGRTHTVRRNEACAVNPEGWSALVRSLSDLPVDRGWIRHR